MPHHRIDAMCGTRARTLTRALALTAMLGVALALVPAAHADPSLVGMHLGIRFVPDTAHAGLQYSPCQDQSAAPTEVEPGDASPTLTVLSPAPSGWVPSVGTGTFVGYESIPSSNTLTYVDANLPIAGPEGTGQLNVRAGVDLDCQAAGVPLPTIGAAVTLPHSTYSTFQVGQATNSVQYCVQATLSRIDAATWGLDLVFGSDDKSCGPPSGDAELAGLALHAVSYGPYVTANEHGSSSCQPEETDVSSGFEVSPTATSTSGWAAIPGLAPGDVYKFADDSVYWISITLNVRIPGTTRWTPVTLTVEAPVTAPAFGCTTISIPVGTTYTGPAYWDQPRGAFYAGECASARISRTATNDYVLDATLAGTPCSNTKPPDIVDTKPAAAPYDAVVFVSGLDSTEQFADPGVVRTGSCDGGGEWETMATRLASSVPSLKVFVAPMTRDDRSQPLPCAGDTSTLPGNLAPNSSKYDDENVDGDRIVALLSQLQAAYGYTRFWLIGHSYGGLWSRAALTDLMLAHNPSLSIVGITTVGTPHTGSFGADIAVNDAATCLIPSTNAIRDGVCALIVQKLITSPTIYGLTAQATATFNAGQLTKRPGGTCTVPIFPIAGTVISGNPFGTGSYYSPSDGIVGESSAFGDGAGIAGLQTAMTVPATHSAGLRALTDWSYPSEAESDDVLLDLETILTKTAPPLVCPAVTAQSYAATSFQATASAVTAGHAAKAPATKVSTRFRARSVALAGVIAGGSTPASVLYNGSHTSLTCDGKPVAAFPLLDIPHVLVTATNECRGTLRAKGTAPVTTLRTLRASLTVALSGTSAVVRASGLPRGASLTVRVGSKVRGVLRADHTLKLHLAKGARRISAAGRVQLAAIAASVRVVVA